MVLLNCLRQFFIRKSLYAIPGEIISEGKNEKIIVHYSGCRNSSDGRGN